MPPTDAESSWLPMRGQATGLPGQRHVDRLWNHSDFRISPAIFKACRALTLRVSCVACRARDLARVTTSLSCIRKDTATRREVCLDADSPRLERRATLVVEALPGRLTQCCEATAISPDARSRSSRWHLRAEPSMSPCLALRHPIGGRESSTAPPAVAQSQGIWLQAMRSSRAWQRMLGVRMI